MIVDGIFNLASTVIDKIWPDPEKKAEALAKLEQMRIDGELAKMAEENKISLAQADINKIDAASVDRFQSRWRPFVGWVCGAAFAYAAIAEPILRFIAKVAFGYAGDFPEIDTNLTLQVLLGILGLGGLRTFEKTRK